MTDSADVVKDVVETCELVVFIATEIVEGMTLCLEVCRTKLAKSST